MRNTLMLLGVVMVAVQAVGQDYVPTDAYTDREVMGWTVRVDPALVAEPELLAEAMAEMEAQLHGVARRMPAAAVERLREVTIWLHLDGQPTCAAYHPSVQWLTNHGLNPDLAKCVDIGNARNFVAWTIHQPFMVMHELAHAYHDRVLGFGHAGVRAAYDAAMEAGGYEAVLHINGRRQPHYAMTNHKEYFAELTESLYGTNDFFPFVRAELLEHDPDGAAAVRAAWESAGDE